MAIRQTRIYAPAHAPYDTQFWAETMMGRIIKTLADDNPQIDWLWMTRYASENPEFEDSDEENVPAGFFDKNQCRNLRFRFEVADDYLVDFERAGSDLIATEGCWNADWRDFDADSLSGDRFLGIPRTDKRRLARKDLVMNYLDSVTQLTLHALVPADKEGRFKIEDNDHIENPNNSAFFSLHHLFCNTTEVLLTALVTNDGFVIDCGSLQYPPNVYIQNNKTPMKAFRIRF